MKSKIKFARILYFICGIVLLLFFIFVPVFVMPKLLNVDINNNFDNKVEKGGFLKLWHIDDFEGGSGNRTNFLKNVGQQFEKEKQGWFVIVQNLTAEEAFNSIIKGKMPDLISFSHFSGYMFQEVLVEYKGGIFVRDDLLNFGKLNGAIKAIPWYLSGYCLIGNSSVNAKVMQTLSVKTMFSYGVEGKKAKPSLTTGLANNGLALLSVLKNNAQACATGDIAENFDKKTTFEAYDDFCNKNSASVLLGTARDFYRVQNKISLGNMSDCKFVPLGEFSDLIGYIGICNTNKDNIIKAREFIEYLTTQKIQMQLS